MSWSYGIYLLLPIAYWIRWKSPANAPDRVARELDHANPAAPDPFRTVLSLANHGENTLGHLDRIFAGIVPGLSLPRPRILPKPHRLALMAGLAAVAIAAAVSGRPGEFLRRASLPWVALEGLPTLRFDLADGVRVLGVGDTAMVGGSIRNLMPGQAVYAYIRTAAGETRFPLAVGADQGFEFAFGPADADFSHPFRRGQRAQSRLEVPSAGRALP